MRRGSARSWRSVDRGKHRPAMEPRKHYPGSRRRGMHGRQHRGPRHRERHSVPAWSTDPGMCGCFWRGNREISSPAACGQPLRSASGRRRAVADDERWREVILGHSRWEAAERSRANGAGGSGAKGRGQGERAPAKHAPDFEPGRRDPGAGARTAKSFAVTHPRWEPYALIGHVRVCAGGAQ